MRRILYYSPVDWNWIKQRPQFIALGLAERGFDIHVMYLRQYRQKGLRRVEANNVPLRPIFRIPPLGYRFSRINRINQRIVRHRVAWEIQHFRPDAIWLTHPSQIMDIPGDFTGQVIYDCMDDYDVLGVQSSSDKPIRSLEQSLCSRADLIFVSSSQLQKKICGRNPDKENRVCLIRNGCTGTLYPRVTGTHSEKLYAGYVGTIAEWFDFDLVLESLKRIPNLEYFLIGPVLVKDPPIHDRIHYLGTIAHENLFDTVKELDCMVMPFRVTDVVLAVDPVKLYEYISWQKNIIAVDYPEIRRFGAFVRKYSDAEEYCSVLTQFQRMTSASYSEAEADCFLKNNTWEKRVDVIQQKLRELEIVDG